LTRGLQQRTYSGAGRPSRSARPSVLRDIQCTRLQVDRLALNISSFSNAPCARALSHLDAVNGTRTKMRRLNVARYTIVLIAIVSSGEGVAQLDQAIPTKDLVDPWNRAKEVLLSLTQSFDSFEEQDKRQLDRELSALDDELSQLQSQEETVAIQIVSNPAFAFDASLSSDQMSRQVSEIGVRLDLLFCDLKVCRRPDVLATQESLASLGQILSDRNRFERDVIRALASGGKNEIQALAVRWWAGSESVGSLREAVANARRELALPPNDDRRH
jgi:hypothetical protein